MRTNMGRRKITSPPSSSAASEIYRTVLFLAILFSTYFQSVNTTNNTPQSRYGGPIKRPSFNTFSRPNSHFPGMLIPSPSHAYSILARPQQAPPRFPQPQPQHFQNHGTRFQVPTAPQLQQQQQFNPSTFTSGFTHQVSSQQHTNTAVQQPVFYPQLQTTSSQQQQQVSFPTNPYQQTLHNSIYQPSQQSVSYYQPTPQPPNINHFPSQYITSSSSNLLNYLPQNTMLQSSSRPVHYHLTKQPLATSSSNNVVAYEPCTSSHWQPIVSAGSVAPPQPNFFQASTISTSRPVAGPAYFRYQPESSNKVVVLSHDVLKTLLANSKNNQQTTKSDIINGVKGIVDNVATAASSASATVVTSNGNSLEKDQPSVKLVGYIGPTSDNTPTGYIQVPVGKNILENLSGSNLGSYDFGVNASQYSLFTMKSVNDAQSLLGVIKSASLDQDTSASQNIPLGLVVSSDGKSQPSVKPADASTLFYPSGTSSSSGGSSSGSSGSSPSIQMVGHVQVTSPDVSSQFTKREGKSDETKAVAEEKSEASQ